MTQYERIDDSKKMILIKLINQKSVKSVITTISKMVLNLLQNFVMVVIGK